MLIHLPKAAGELSGMLAQSISPPSARQLSSFPGLPALQPGALVSLEIPQPSPSAYSSPSFVL